MLRQFIIKPKPHLLNSYLPLLHFSTGSQYNTLNLPINDYLKKSLTANHIYEVKPFQYQMLMESKMGGNCFVNSCTGSGKTLAYLLPILDALIGRAQQRAKDGQKGRDGQHGAVILTLNKELCLQIYKTIRLLDPQQLLEVKRIGPISHYLPIVNLLSNQPKTKSEADLIDSKMNNNLVNTIKWPTTDILVSTPQLLLNLMQMSEYRNSRDFLRPRFLVFDQADLLLEIDRNLSRSAFKIVEDVSKNLKGFKTKEGEIEAQMPQYMIAASSFPPKLAGIDYQEGLKKKFGQIKQIKGQLKHQIPSTIDLFSIQLENTPETKQSYLKKILLARPGQRILIFCNTKASVTQICQTLKNDLDLNCDAYHASLDSNERSRVLHRFETGKNLILVCTDLGARGLDFGLPVHLIIQYEMAENVTGFINRVGRTGRNNVKGEVITMVVPENEQLFRHIEELVSQNQQLDEVFSRKRSYRKLYKEQL